jgi:RNA polymerase sigma-70 factor (ECF subfamily)
VAAALAKVAGLGERATHATPLPARIDPVGLDRWFARVLHNAALDTLRRSAAERRALARLSTEPHPLASPPPGSARRPCPCAHQEIEGLSRPYAEVLAAVHGADQPIASFAAREGLTVNNATVRLHRARRALRDRVLTHCGACAEDGCRDCDCAEARQAL